MPEAFCEINGEPVDSFDDALAAIRAIRDGKREATAAETAAANAAAAAEAAAAQQGEADMAAPED